MPPGIGYPPTQGQAPNGSTSPAVAKPDQGGNEIRGKVWADLAMKALIQAVTIAGPDTDPGRACIDALKGLSKAFPAPPSPEITAQELKLYGSQIQPAPGSQPPQGNPAQRAGSFMQGLGLGGGAQQR